MQISTPFCKQKPNGWPGLKRRSDHAHLEPDARFVFSCTFSFLRAETDVRKSGRRLKVETFSERDEEEEKEAANSGCVILSSA